ncbi:hypothetical protein GPECTOR_39g412 [Gonium pectorale]|uniref:Uncharacterized protein n=1 Tax=Gonium pectorale TaxID=33097 RepID=A0A150GAS2_GONPE|nr:hypothetical protein GPECTOR_39g412 [Gonium pectorale]|eukprot:KXZ46918.1 hypothetical protein GPECTOR_39g412 [Gonium pectorale]
MKALLHLMDRIIWKDERASWRESYIRWAVFEAASGGHTSVVVWLVESSDVDLTLGPGFINAVAASGSRELLTWALENGGWWDDGTFAEAAKGGNGTAMEWLLERGCPWGDCGDAYANAALAHDWATLRLLRRLRCPWGPRGYVFSRAVSKGAALPVLRWLLEQGCLVKRRHIWRLMLGAERPDADDILDMVAMQIP